MEELNEKKQNRREFIRDIIRYSILGGLVSIFGTLFVKHKISVDDYCTKPYICEVCQSFGNCEKIRKLEK